MERTLIINGLILNENRLIKNGAILIDGDTISEVGALGNYKKDIKM